jgi:hypothetical protein
MRFDRNQRAPRRRKPSKSSVRGTVCRRRPACGYQRRVAAAVAAMCEFPPDHMVRLPHGLRGRHATQIVVRRPPLARLVFWASPLQRQASTPGSYLTGRKEEPKRWERDSSHRNVKASHSNNDAATKRLMTIHCVNVPRPEKRSAKAPTSHLKRLATAPISHSRNHSSGLSVRGHRNMVLESDLLTRNRSHIVLIAAIRNRRSAGRDCGLFRLPEHRPVP